MATTVTTHTSWFSRLGSSIKNVFLGAVLIIASIVLLFWNEGRAVATYKSLKEGASAVVSVSSEVRDAANEGKLVHFTGLARTPDILTDTEFGAGGSALKLMRTVELYQWKENTKSETVEKLGGGTDTTTEYTYSKDWAGQIIDSSNFKEPEVHQNPTTKAFADKEWIAENVSVGAYQIPETLLESLQGYVPLAVTREMILPLPYARQNEVRLSGGLVYYQTLDPTNPEIGNTRISYEIIAPQEISVIAKQTGETLTAYETKNGREISMIQLGTSSAEEMFAGAVAANRTTTWVIRILGVIIMFVGFRMGLGVLAIVASVIPFLGRIVGAGTSFAAFLFTFAASLATIALAWITYRPVLGVALLALSVAAILFARGKPKK